MKIGAAISSPRIAGGKITDMRLFPTEAWVAIKAKEWGAVLPEGVLDQNGQKWSKRPFWSK